MIINIMPCFDCQITVRIAAQRNYCVQLVRRSKSYKGRSRRREKLEGSFVVRGNFALKTSWVNVIIFKNIHYILTNSIFRGR